MCIFALLRDIYHLRYHNNEMIREIKKVSNIYLGPFSAMNKEEPDQQINLSYMYKSFVNLETLRSLIVRVSTKYM